MAVTLRIILGGEVTIRNTGVRVMWSHGTMHIGEGRVNAGMVVETERDDATWYECEDCGLLFDEREDAATHEQNCDAEEPSYIQ